MMQPVTWIALTSHRPASRAVAHFPRRKSMKNVAASILILLGLSACAGPGGVAPSGGLMYRLPEPSTVVYLTESRSDINIDAAGMGSFGMRGTSEATVGVTFTPGTDGLQVTATVQKLAASMTQPMGGSQSASEADIDGDIVFSLDRRGKAQVISLPPARGAAEQLANPLGFVHELFPRLPGAVVGAGATWTDTIQYQSQTSQGDVSSSVVVVYTLQGDTIVGGASLLNIAYEGKADVQGATMTEGMQVLQSMTGTVSGIVLWDASRSLLVADEGSQNMTGAVEVPGAGIPPMPMSMRGTSSTRLQGG